MHSLLYLILLTGTCLAHYRGLDETRNFILREEPFADDEGVFVECPVCDDSEPWITSNEECLFKRGNKHYKKCKLGTYINKVCADRLDCYRGPGEQCTDKREFDTYGKKCAPGYYCNKSLGICTGVEYQVDSNTQLQLNRFPYTWRRSEPKGHSSDIKYFEGTRLSDQ